ncbi:uncharacterized protein LAESUDRAFT_814393 [Laetiporus sulphureus 93-53]|uniref:BTB domain-containing protein n=1 Tax=Laetiporus sulphureus 93-53 TaxID=1314785 RepID=A0A165D271_9APHY|nr:uncharacterized protein LAESUDRAFT_814393 [Laetiporus sulphureus 93-53]KZT04006.1 hypothetical protein LAESUDRAFT_814393 [Laetiporus sulphureus 93-53]
MGQTVPALMDPEYMHRYAGPPFNDKDADVVLRSSDNVDFYVYGQFLKYMSPLFSSLFDQTTSPPPPWGRPEHWCLPEHSTTLDPLLRLCYPQESVQLVDCMVTLELLKVSEKYQLRRMVLNLKKRLRELIRAEANPLRGFVAACGANLEEEAAWAAQAWSTAPTAPNQGIVAWIPEMSQLTGGQYYRLLEFRTHFRRTGRALDKSIIVRAADVVKEETPDIDMHTNRAAHPFALPTETTDLVLRSCDGEMFFVNKTVVTIAAPKMADMFDQPDLPLHQDYPIVSLPEKAQVVRCLLEAVWPTVSACTLDAEDPWNVALMLNYADKWGMIKASTEITHVWQMAVDSLDAFECYLAATRRGGWGEEADTCMRYASAIRHTDRHSLQLEIVSASVYHRFLLYRWRMRLAVFEELKKELPGDIGDEQVARQLLYWADNDNDFAGTPDVIPGAVSGLCLLISRKCDASSALRRIERIWTQLLTRIALFAAHITEGRARNVDQIEAAIKTAFKQIDPGCPDDDG